MTLAVPCPDNFKLSQLIEGSLDHVDQDRITEHVESCEKCQQTLQTIATGEIAVEELVADLEDIHPPQQSAYWRVIADIKQEQQSQLNPVVDQSAVDTPVEGVRALAKTKAFRDEPRRKGSSEKVDTSASEVAAQEGEPNQGNGLSFLSPSDDPAYIGKLHHFQIARVIGRGGMGIVLDAFDTHLQRSVAIKVLNPQFQENDVARQRFCREGRAAAAISHEHVVAMHQVAHASEDGVAYLVMQLIDGVTLENQLASKVPLPAQEVARIGMQIAAGLSAAHARGMVHRDIKPANILIETETNRVKLTDFGLARATDDVKLTQTGMVTGTPLYMSPEQTLGKTADERSDLFSMGAVMYEMATGKSPFEAPTAVGVMKRIIDELPKPPHQVNALIGKPLSDLIMSLLAKSPDERPESSSTVATALASIVTEYGPISPLQVPAVAATEVKKLSGTYRRSQRRWTIVAWLAAAAAIVVAAVTYLIFRPDAGDSFPSIVLSGNPGTVWSVDFSPTGETLAAAIEDGSVRVWNIDEQSLVQSFNAHRGIVWMVEYHPSRPIVVTSGDDSWIKLWNAETFELIKEWKATSSVRSVAFSPNGDRIVAGDRDGGIHVFDIDSGETLNTHIQAGSIFGVDYSADGKYIATAGSDKVIRIFDAESLTERKTLVGHDGPIYGVRFAGSGDFLASVGWNQNVRIWNSETGEQIQSLIGSEGDVWGLDFCGGASHLVTGEQEGAAHVWDLKTNQIVATLRGHQSAVHNVSLDPSAHRIATSSRDGTIRVWDMSSISEK
ncbi:MAG: serine/threonine-protein kinase [Planctomycetota bacterium]